jgi:hypothetical protein
VVQPHGFRHRTRPLRRHLQRRRRPVLLLPANQVEAAPVPFGEGPGGLGNRRLATIRQGGEGNGTHTRTERLFGAFHTSLGHGRPECPLTGDRDRQLQRRLRTRRTAASVGFAELTASLSFFTVATSSRWPRSFAGKNSQALGYFWATCGVSRLLAGSSSAAPACWCVPSRATRAGLRALDRSTRRPVDHRPRLADRSRPPRICMAPGREPRLAWFRLGLRRLR